jgi:hypothetical protein
MSIEDRQLTFTPMTSPTAYVAPAASAPNIS